MPSSPRFDIDLPISHLFKHALRQVCTFNFIFTGIFCSLIFFGSSSQVWASPTPANIISLAPAITEIVCALGAGDQLLAISQDCNYPAAVQSLPRVGRFLRPNLEKIVTMQPTYVLAIGNQASPQVQQLRQLGIKVQVYSSPASLAAVFAMINELGCVLGKQTSAKALCQKMQSEIASHPKPSPKPKVLFVIWPSPLLVAGQQTFINDLIVNCGGENIAPSSIQAFPRLNPEAILQAAPDLIILAHAGNLPPRLQQLCQTTPAGKHGHLITCPNPDVLLRPGPRLGEGATWLQREIAKSAVSW